MKTTHVLSVILPVGMIVAGCQAPTVCAAIANPGIRVDVRDSITNAFAGDGARVIGTEGTFADTAVALPDKIPFQLVHARAGTYQVTVKQDGYQPWSQSGVRVTTGKCGVRTVSLVARLQR